MEKKKRPEQLSNFLDNAAKGNDTSIIEALEKLEDPLRRGKLKPTVATVEMLTGLSRNTIRNRSWALNRLKDIKKDIKAKSAKSDDTAVAQEEEKPVEEKLREKVKALTEQNVQLFEEVLTLQEANVKLHREMEELRIVKLRLV